MMDRKASWLVGASVVIGVSTSWMLVDAAVPPAGPIDGAMSGAPPVRSGPVAPQVRPDRNRVPVTWPGGPPPAPPARDGDQVADETPQISADKSADAAAADATGNRASSRAALAEEVIALDPEETLFAGSAGTNNGYSGGRGMVFVADEPITVRGGDFYTRAESDTLNVTFELWELATTSGSVLTGATLLVSATDTIYGGLGYYRTDLDPTPLKPETPYLLRVLYTEIADENWFYAFDPVFYGDPPVDIGPVTLIDGTQGGSTGNTVAPALRLAFEPPPACMIDQYQPYPDVYVAALTQDDLAQSFKPAHTRMSGAGVLLRADIGTTGPVVIELWDRLPNEAGALMLASGETTGEAGYWAQVTWSPVTVTPGRTYYLVFDGPDFLGLAGSTDPYPDGQTYANTGFIPYPAFDYTFRTCWMPEGVATEQQLVCEEASYFSNLNSNHRPYLRYDDFTGNGSGYLADVTFWGGGWDVNSFSPCDLTTIVDAFEISIYDWEGTGTCGWEPGALLHTERIPFAEIERAFECVSFTIGMDMYRFTAHLAGQCYVEDGRQYALRVAADLINPDDSCIFAWGTSTPVQASHALSIDRTDGTCLDTGYDNAFSLSYAGACCSVLFGAATGTTVGNAPSSLYTIDPVTGVASLVGPIGFNGVTGLVFAPDGTLYATANGDDIWADGNKHAILLRINPDTGEGTLVGEISNSSLPDGAGRMPDIAFHSTGVLYGYADSGTGGDALWTIDTVTGAGAFIGHTGFTGGGNGLAIAMDNTFYATPNDNQCLVEIDPATGAGACVPGTSGNVPWRVNALAFCPGTRDVYASWNDTATSYLVTLDVVTGEPTTVLPTVLGLDAIAFPCIAYEAPCEGRRMTIADNGLPNDDMSLRSEIGGPSAGDPPTQVIDDFFLEYPTEINEIHWFTAEYVEGIAWMSDVLVEVYADWDMNCMPDGGPIVSLFARDAGATVSRSITQYPVPAGDRRVRYDITGLSIPMVAGHYFLSVAPLCIEGEGLGSYWTSSRSAGLGDTLVGCEGLFRSAYFGYPTWAPYGSHDYNFTLTSCRGCPPDVNGDGVADILDLLALLADWGGCGPVCPCDVDGSGTVDILDLLDLLGAWGPCP